MLVYFAEMQKKNLITKQYDPWRAQWFFLIISNLGKSGKLREMLDYYNEMDKIGLIPTPHLLTYMINLLQPLPEMKDIVARLKQRLHK